MSRKRLLTMSNCWFTDLLTFEKKKVLTWLASPSEGCSCRCRGGRFPSCIPWWSGGSRAHSNPNKDEPLIWIEKKNVKNYIFSRISVKCIAWQIFNEIVEHQDLFRKNMHLIQIIRRKKYYFNEKAFIFFTYICKM